MQVPTEKPGSPEEIVHFGVKGMKWGVRRSKQTQAFRKKFPTRRARDAEILRARGQLTADFAKVHAGKTRKERKALKKEFLKHPDAATARRLMTGQKVALGILALVPPVGTAAVGATVAVNVGRRRSIEDK